MKLLLTLPLLLMAVVGMGQTLSKISYKHNEIDGWIKITESAWFTISQKGDTTFWAQTLEETDQADPSVKPKYEFDGLGNLIKPDTVVKKEVVAVPVRMITPISVYDTFTQYRQTAAKGKVEYKYKPVYKTKYKKGKVVYRNRYRYIKPIVAKKKKEPKPETISIITYKKRLWIAGATITCTKVDFTTQQVIEASTKEKATKVFMAWCKHAVKPENGNYIGVKSQSLGVYEFSQWDILR